MTRRSRSEGISSDAASRLGRPGRLARRSLSRLMRPAIAHADARSDELSRALAEQGTLLRSAVARMDELQRGQDVLGTEVRSVHARVEAVVAVQDREAGRLNADIDALSAMGARLADAEQRAAADLLDLRTTLARIGGLSGQLASARLPAEGETAVIPSGRTGGPRRAICSHATGPYRSMLSLAATSFTAYAERWGWDVVLSADSSLADGRPQAWAKVPLLQRLLEDYEYVWWIDADAVIVDLDRDLCEVFEEAKELYVVQHRFDWDYGDGKQAQLFPNSGVFVVKAGPWSRNHFEAIWSREDLAESPWWENTAFLELIGYGTYPAGPRRETPWRDRIAFVDTIWNSLDDLDEATDPVVRHHAGNAPFEERRWRVLKDVLALAESLD
jgi:hypothetical protein